jgi:hypothetical protein
MGHENLKVDLTSKPKGKTCRFESLKHEGLWRLRIYLGVF